MDRWVYGCMYGWMDGRIDRWMIRRMDGCTGDCVDGWMDGGKDRQTNRQTCGWMDGWMSPLRHSHKRYGRDFCRRISTTSALPVVYPPVAPPSAFPSVLLMMSTCIISCSDTGFHSFISLLSLTPLLLLLPYSCIAGHQQSRHQ